MSGANPKRLGYGTFLAGAFLTDEGLSLAAKRYRVTASWLTGSEQDIGLDLPAQSIVLAAFVIVATAEATGTTKTLDVGLLSSESGGDADGFLDGLSVAATGLIFPTLASGAQTLGALLSVDEGGTGELVPEAHSTDSVTAKSISVTAGSADFAELIAEVVVVYLEMRN